MKYKLKVFSQKHSRAIQEFAFSKGFIWPSGHEHCLYLGAPYIYLEDNGETKYITHGSVQEYFENANQHQEVTLEELASMLNKTMCFHGDLIIQYAEDVKKYEKPWELWQWCTNSENLWSDCDKHPSWYAGTKYRKKPNAVAINGIVNGDIWVYEKQTKIVITDAEENKAFSLDTHKHFVYDPTKLSDLVIRVAR